jgi:hypothetical protein
MIILTCRFWIALRIVALSLSEIPDKRFVGEKLQILHLACLKSLASCNLSCFLFPRYVKGIAAQNNRGRPQPQSIVSHPCAQNCVSIGYRSKTRPIHCSTFSRLCTLRPSIWYDRVEPVTLPTAFGSCRVLAWLLKTLQGQPYFSYAVLCLSVVCYVVCCVVL